MPGMKCFKVSVVFFHDFNVFIYKIIATFISYHQFKLCLFSKLFKLTYLKFNIDMKN